MFKQMNRGGRLETNKTGMIEYGNHRKHGKINVLDKEPNEEAEDKAWKKNRSQMNLKIKHGLEDEQGNIRPSIW